MLHPQEKFKNIYLYTLYTSESLICVYSVTFQSQIPELHANYVTMHFCLRDISPGKPIEETVFLEEETGQVVKTTDKRHTKKSKEKNHSLVQPIPVGEGRTRKRIWTKKCILRPWALQD